MARFFRESVLILMLSFFIAEIASCPDPKVRITTRFPYAKFTSLRQNATMEESGLGNRLTCVCDYKPSRKTWLASDGTKLVLNDQETVVYQKKSLNGASLLLRGAMNCSHAGVYVCRLDDGRVEYLIEPADGEDCTPKEVTIEGGPSEPVAGNATVVLTCSAQSSPASPLTYGWRVNGEEVGAGQGTVQVTVSRDSTVTCVASSALGNSSTSIHIIVLQVPTVGFIVDRAKHPEGTTINLTVSRTGFITNPLSFSVGVSTWFRSAQESDYDLETTVVVFSQVKSDYEEQNVTVFLVNDKLKEIVQEYFILSLHLEETGLSVAYSNQYCFVIIKDVDYVRTCSVVDIREAPFKSLKCTYADTE